MRNVITVFIVLLGISLLALPQPYAHAQPHAQNQAKAQNSESISTDITPSFGANDDIFSLSITASGSGMQDLHYVSFEDSELFSVTPSGTSTRQQIINGARSSETELSFQVSVKKELKPGTYPLPSATAELNGKKVTIPSAEITIVQTAPAAQKASTNDKVSISQYFDKKEAYVGEQLTYTVEITHDNSFLGGNLEEYDPSGFWRESLGNKERNVYSIGRKTINTFQEVFIPTKSGTLSVPSRALRARLRAPYQRRAPRRRDRNSIFQDRLFGSLLNRPREVRKNLRTNDLEVLVKPLPPHPFPSYIPVGDLEVETFLSTSEIDASGSATLTISLAGTGNLRPFSIQKSKRVDGQRDKETFKLYFDEPILKAIAQESKVIYQKVFPISILPRKTGSLIVPQFEIVFFDPETEQYSTVVTKPLQLLVTGTIDPSSKLSVAVEETEDMESPSNEYDELKRFSQSAVSAPTVSRKLSYIVSGLILLLGALANLLIRYRMLKSRRSRKQNALPTAIAAITSAESINSELLEKEVKVFLESFFGIPAQNQTSAEIVKAVQRAVKDESIVRQTEELLTSIEKEKFAADSVGTNHSISEQALRLLKHLESKS